MMPEGDDEPNLDFLLVVCIQFFCLYFLKRRCFKLVGMVLVVF